MTRPPYHRPNCSLPTIILLIAFFSSFLHFSLISMLQNKGILLRTWIYLEGALGFILFFYFRLIYAQLNLLLAAWVEKVMNCWWWCRSSYTKRSPIWWIQAWVFAGLFKCYSFETIQLRTIHEISSFSFVMW